MESFDGLFVFFTDFLRVLSILLMYTNQNWWDDDDEFEWWDAVHIGKQKQAMMLFGRQIDIYLLHPACCTEMQKNGVLIKV